MWNKLVRIVSQNFYMSAELISANRGVWLGSAEFISAISEYFIKFFRAFFSKSGRISERIPVEKRPVVENQSIKIDSDG